MPQPSRQPGRSSQRGPSQQQTPRRAPTPSAQQPRGNAAAAGDLSEAGGDEDSSTPTLDAAGQQGQPRGDDDGTTMVGLEESGVRHGHQDVAATPEQRNRLRAFAQRVMRLTAVWPAQRTTANLSFDVTDINQAYLDFRNGWYASYHYNPPANDLGEALDQGNLREILREIASFNFHLHPDITGALHLQGHFLRHQYRLKLMGGLDAHAILGGRAVLCQLRYFNEAGMGWTKEAALVFGTATGGLEASTNHGLESGELGGSVLLPTGSEMECYPEEGQIIYFSADDFSAGARAYLVEASLEAGAHVAQLSGQMGGEVSGIRLESNNHEVNFKEMGVGGPSATVAHGEEHHGGGGAHGGSGGGAHGGSEGGAHGGSEGGAHGGSEGGAHGGSEGGSEGGAHGGSGSRRRRENGVGLGGHLTAGAGVVLPVPGTTSAASSNPHPLRQHHAHRQDREILAFQTVDFDTGAAEIGPSQMQDLQDLVQHMQEVDRRFPGALFHAEIEGSASPRWRGARSAAEALRLNRQLANRRTANTRAALRGLLTGEHVRFTSWVTELSDTSSTSRVGQGPADEDSDADRQVYVTITWHPDRQRASDYQVPGENPTPNDS